MSVPLDEQETTINIMRDTDECYIYTSDSTMMTKLDKLVEKSDKWTVAETYFDAETHECVGVTYRTNKRLITFRADFLKSNMTDEQRAAASERMKEIGKRNRKNQN